LPPVPFDTHAVIQQLEQMGFPTPQAEGLSAVLTQVVAGQDYATKADLTEGRLSLEVKLEQLRVELHRELGTVKNELGFLRWAAYVLGALLIPVFLRTVLKL
jgi:hypothetical protein